MTQMNQTIEQLNNLYLDFENKTINLKSRYRSKDARLAYYYLSYQNIDATINLLILNEENIKYDQRMTPLYNSFGIGRRFDNLTIPLELRLSQTRKNIEQFIANQYSLSIFCIFEHSFRTIIREIYPSEYKNLENRFINMFEHFVKEFRNQSPYFSTLKPSFFVFLNAVRNTIHTNGIYLPYGKNVGYTRILPDLNGTPILFEYGKVIPYNGVWESHVQMGQLFFSIFNELIEIPSIQSRSYVEDPSIL
jgi:hypothetical protein